MLQGEGKRDRERVNQGPEKSGDCRGWPLQMSRSPGGTEDEGEAMGQIPPSPWNCHLDQGQSE